MIDPALRALLDRKNELKNELINTNILIRTKKLELIKKFHGVKPGSIVEYGGKEFKVSSVKAYTWNGRPACKPWVAGVGRKRDGEFGTREKELFDGWKLVKK